MQTNDAITVRPGIISRNPQNCNLKSNPLSGRTAWDIFPTGTPDCCYLGLPSAVCLDVGRPNLVMYVLLLYFFYFSFNDYI